MEISQQALDALYPSMAPAAKPVTLPPAPAPRDAASILYGAPAVQTAPASPRQPVAQTAPPSPDPATLLYDTPADGVFYGEQPLDRIEAVQLDLPNDVAGQIGPGELPQVKAALIAAEVGHTLAGSFVKQATAAMRTPITTTPEQAEAALRQKFGPGAAVKIAAARGMIEQAAKRWPGVWNFLDRSGLGNSPHLIEQLAARAARRSGR